MHWTSIIPSTDLSPLVEIAFRGLLLAVFIATGIAVLRIRNVVTQKAAWIVALAAAFAMPAIVPLAGMVPLSPEEVLQLPFSHRAPAAQPPVSVARIVVQAAPTLNFYDAAGTDTDSLSTASVLDQADAPPASFADVSPNAAAGIASHPFLNRQQLLFLLYCAVCLTLLFRVVRGLILTHRLWRSAEPVHNLAVEEQTGRISVRSSRQISSPLNIGSGILLPCDFAEWDADKLAIVLAHEASHVRQRDFYLQLAAQLYAAIFWFSPLGWWIGHKLSDLSEAISDRAGLHNAASPAAYAQILLEFAALARPSTTGVAMARPGRLTQRIERLLNESSFRQAFAASRIRIAATVLLVPAALFTATALVRVQAAQVPQAPAAAPPPLAAPPQPTPPASAPMAIPAKPQVATPPPPATPAVVAAPKLNDDLRLTMPALPPVPVTANIPALPAISLVTKIPPLLPVSVLLSDVTPELAMANGLLAQDAETHVKATNHYGAYTFDKDGAFYGFFQRFGGHPHFTGTWLKGHQDALAKAEQLAKGDFILYTDPQGKSYYVDDPQYVAQMEAYTSTVRSLETEKRSMQRAQQELARAQSRMAAQQAKATVSKADLQKDLADLSAAVAKIEAQKGNSLTSEQLSELESKLGQMQSKLVQVQIADKLSNIHFDSAALERRIAEIDSQQAGSSWGGAFSHNSDEVLKSLVQDALKNGKAKPVN